MKWTTAMTVMLILTACTANAKDKGGKKIGHVSYSHDMASTKTQPATNMIEEKIEGWRICHDPGSEAGFLAISNTEDPELDGTRIGPGQCFECPGCTSETLTRANVKSDVDDTGYSVVQFKK